MNTAFDVGATLLGSLFGNRRATTAVKSAVRGASRYSRQSGDVSRAEQTMEAIAGQLDALEQQFHEEVSAVQFRLDASNELLEVVVIKPKKTNVQVRLITLAWAPFKADGSPAWE